jgi:hypothetical protein
VGKIPFNFVSARLHSGNAAVLIKSLGTWHHTVRRTVVIILLWRYTTNRKLIYPAVLRGENSKVVGRSKF